MLSVDQLSTSEDAVAHRVGQDSTIQITVHWGSPLPFGNTECPSSPGTITINHCSETTCHNFFFFCKMFYISPSRFLFFCRLELKDNDNPWEDTVCVCVCVCVCVRACVRACVAVCWECHQNSPSISSIMRWITNFPQTGSFNESPRSGRPSMSQQTVENLQI